MALLIAASLALIMIAAAVWLFAQARAKESEETFADRVGQLGAGAEAIDEFAGLRNLQRIKNPVTRAVCHRFWGAGIDVSPISANLWMAALIVITVLMMLVSPLLGVAVGAGIIGFGYLILQQRVYARRRRIMHQLPDYLEYVMRSLTAGNSLEEALQSAALESNDPIRSLFLSVSRQVRLGATVEGTLSEAGDVHDLRALHIMAMAARVNRRYGGSMRRVIKSLIATIRRQDAAARELKALTGETRFSAWVVAAIPILISLFFYLRNPGYYADILASSTGRIIMVVAVILQLLGLLLIWRMLASVQEPDV